MSCPIASSIAALIFLAFAECGLGNEATERTPVPTTETPVAAPLRLVRVLIVGDTERVRVRCDKRIIITGFSTEAAAKPARFASNTWHDVVLGADKTAILIQGVRFPLPARLAGDQDTPISIDPAHPAAPKNSRRYPGTLVFQRSARATLEIVNEVDIERYVASVVASELPAGFHPKSFEVGAIVARTFVLDQMLRRNRSGYDVGAGQGAQVYRGIAHGAASRQATAAARDTYGLVCTWRGDAADHLFPTYYSSVCGGMSQSAVIFGGKKPPPPLRGGVSCDYCRIAPKSAYQWDSVEIPLVELYQRLTKKYPELVALERIVAVKISERTPSGRPLRIKLIGSSDKSFVLLAERFRLALDPTTVRSTQFDLSIERGKLVLTGGRGFGHGLGLCQWGAEGQARDGKDTGAILRYYYPGSVITRVY